MPTKLSSANLDQAFQALETQLELLKSDPIRLVICGGSALIARGFVTRLTDDVDIVALMNAKGVIGTPEPLLESLTKSAAIVARDMGLSADWLSNAVSRDVEGVFQRGLPTGFEDRLEKQRYGRCLTAFFIGRLDQIYFKLYAAADRGGHHIKDLIALRPTARELEFAAAWTRSHDSSEGIWRALQKLIRKLGHDDIADRI